MPYSSPGKRQKNARKSQNHYFQLTSDQAFQEKQRMQQEKLEKERKKEEKKLLLQQKQKEAGSPKESYQDCESCASTSEQ